MLPAFSEVREQFDFVTSTCGSIGKKHASPCARAKRVQRHQQRAPDIAAAAMRVSDRGSDLRFAAGAIRKRLENIPARDNACQSMVAVHCGNAPDPMIDHELEHAREFGVGSNVDEFGRHDIGDGPVHQLLIMWNHLARRKNKTFQ
jgi:hypothetical protein